MTINKKRSVLMLTALLATFVVLRVSLYLSPGANLDIGPYNIHHLFTGLLLITFAGLPLVLLQGNHRILDIASVVFGAGLSMALDEWVYLIFTDGSDQSYLLPISLWGAVVVIGSVTVCKLALIFISDHHKDY